ncbi:MAG: MsnO8 family LLM class oxidoreductase, partial [Chloroflexota bacterium]
MTILSILDLSPVATGRTASEAIEDSVLLAQTAESLGKHRAWYAEHHNFVGLASGSPEIMISHIASRTSRIRVGSGGIMLPNHAPLRIAEAFQLLEAMHPGRIDLGLGRAPGTDQLTAAAMGRNVDPRRGDDYPQQLDELIAFGNGTLPVGHHFAGIQAIPFGSTLPPMWLLGSSDYSAIQAAKLGLGYAFAAHINFPNAVNALSLYRS